MLDMVALEHKGVSISVILNQTKTVVLISYRLIIN